MAKKNFNAAWERDQELVWNDTNRSEYRTGRQQTLAARKYVEKTASQAHIEQMAKAQDIIRSENARLQNHLKSLELRCARLSNVLGYFENTISNRTNTWVFKYIGEIALALEDKVADIEVPFSLIQKPNQRLVAILNDLKKLHIRQYDCVSVVNKSNRDAKQKIENEAARISHLSVEKLANYGIF